MLLAIATHFMKRIPIVLSGFLLFSVVIFNVGCQKEGSLENSGPGAGPGGTAVFLLVPSGTNCSDAVISGPFQAGTLLSIDSKLTITVNVTQAGSWTCSTAKVNGFVFSGAGNFTSTGTQVIVLQATGTPTAAGNFIFKLNIGGIVCALAVDVVVAGGGNTTDEIYYKATIGGVNYFQSVTATNNYEAGSGMGGTDDVVFGGGINYANPPLPAGLTQMSVDKGLMHNYLSATKSQFKAFFAPGIYPYAPASYSLGDGISIVWNDPLGGDWDTRDGTVDQAGSNFKIISTEDSYDAIGRYYIKVKMQFNCKLYNRSTGAVTVLTNGEMVAYFGML